MKKLLKLGLYLLIIFPIAVLSSCDKDYININITNPEGDNLGNGGNGGGNGNLLEVCFMAGTSSYAPTRANTYPLQKDRYVTVYCFENLCDFVDSLRYATTRRGVLTPTRGNPLELYANRYEFYAVGIGNSSLDPVTFTNLNSGLSMTQLDNGIDYLAGSMIDVKIVQDTNLLFDLSHEATQVMFEIFTKDGTDKITSFSDVSITPPSNTSNVMSLFTGRISPSKSIMADSPIDMNISGTLLSQILLPLEYTGSLTLNFTAYLNNSVNGQPYSTNVEVPNGALKAGNCYIFSVELGESTVSITNVQVKNWTDVDETGTPIIPTPL